MRSFASPEKISGHATAIINPVLMGPFKYYITYKDGGGVAKLSKEQTRFFNDLGGKKGIFENKILHLKTLFSQIHH